MLNKYPVEEREKARRTHQRLASYAEEARKAAEQGIALSPESEEIVAVLTKTSDMSHRTTILTSLAEEVRGRHLSKLQVLAPTEFAAFCEYVNPDEPPESKWHQYLTGELQAIEYDHTRHRVILNCPPGHAKPLHVDTPILMGDNSWKRLGDIVVGDEVVAHTGKPRKVTAVHEQGVQPILRITTKMGRIVLSAPDHSFWVEPADGYLADEAGWKRADQLRPGHKLKLVHKADTSQAVSTADTSEATFAAVAQALGSMSWMKGRNLLGNYRSYHIYAVNAERAYDYSALMFHLGIKHSLKPLKGGVGYVLRVATPDANALAAKFRFDDRRETRRVPDFIMEGTEEEKKQYLSTYFSIQGECPTRFGGRWLYVHCHSHDFAYDIQKLLGYFNVPTTIDCPKGRHLRVIISEGLKHYLETIPYAGPHTNRLSPTPGAAKADEDEVDCVELGDPAECRCLTVDVDHTFIANGVVVHNSTYASRLFVAWRLGRDPNQRIIGGGHSQKFVENEFSKKIRDLVRSKEYRDIFPKTALSPHTSSANQWGLAGYKGQYVARGVGQGVHGFRATFICVDDPYSKVEDAESPVIREKVNTWFTTDIGSRVLPGGKVFVIMTRFHADDLTGHLMDMNHKLPTEDKWQLIEAPAICYDESTDIMNRRLGEVLWDYYSLGFFRTKRAELLYQRYALIYQQLTDAASDTSIAGSFKYYRYLPHKEPEVISKARAEGKVDPETGKLLIDRKDYFRRVVLSVDTASKPTDRADYTVIQVWGETHDRKHYLFYQKRVKVDFNRMIEEIESTAIRYHVDSILVEDKGQGTAYIQARGQTDYQRRKAPAPLIPINPGTQSKEFRFDEVCPMIEAGEVYLPEDADWLDTFIVEVGQFPQGAHDDQVDALSQYLRWAKSTRSRFGSRKVTSMG